MDGSCSASVSIEWLLDSSDAILMSEVMRIWNFLKVVELLGGGLIETSSIRHDSGTVEMQWQS